MRLYVKLGFVCILLVFVISFFVPWSELLISEKDIGYVYVKQFYDFDNMEWTDQYAHLFAFGNSIYFMEEVFYDSDFKDGHLFTLLSPTKNNFTLKVTSLDPFESDLVHVEDGVLISTDSINATDYSVLYYSGSENNTFIIQGINRVGPYFGKISELTHANNKLYYVVSNEDKLSVCDYNGPLITDYVSTFSPVEINKKLSYIGIGDNNESSIFFEDQTLNSKFGEVTELFSSDGWISYTTKDQNTVNFIKRKLITLFGKTYVLGEKLVYALPYDTYLQNENNFIKNNFYSISCPDYDCTVLKNGKNILSTKRIFDYYIYGNIIVFETPEYNSRVINSLGSSIKLNRLTSKTELIGLI